MNPSPGHRRWPDHKVDEQPVPGRLEMVANGEPVAASSDVIRVDEDRHPPRHYFPRADVRMDRLERSDKTTECPFKGTAQYYHVVAGGRTLNDAAWSYEDPYDEHAALKGRLAFHDERLAGLQLRAG